MYDRSHDQLQVGRGVCLQGVCIQGGLHQGAGWGSASGGLHPGVFLQEAGPRPARTRKAGGTHPTGILSCICISPLQANKISRF